MRSYSSDTTRALTKKLKLALAGKDPSGKATVDSSVAEKIEILKRLPGNPVAEKLIDIYESGKQPTDDDLKAIRHQLYRNRMRNEANSFRTANMTLDDIVEERYAAEKLGS